VINARLLLKEFASLRFCFVLVLSFSGIVWLFYCMTEFPDRPDVTVGNDEQDAMTLLFNSLLIGILVGLAMIGQERENRTLAFLDGLPVSRWNLFFHKVLAALVVIVLSELFQEADSFLTNWLVRDSLSDPIDYPALYAGFTTRLLLTTAVAGVAAFLSFSRKLFPFLLGLLISIFLWIGLKDGPLSSWMDTEALLLPSTTDDRILWPTKQMLCYSCLGIWGWLMAILMFVHRDGRVTMWMDRLSEQTSGGIVTTVAYALAVGVWFINISQLENSGAFEDEDRDRPAIERAVGVDESWKETAESTPSLIDTFSKFETQHFDIICRKSAKSRLQSLYPDIDEIHRQVLDYFLNPMPVPGRIVLDTGAIIPSHAAGITNWTKVRVSLGSLRDQKDFLQVLRHEVGHVYIENLSDGKATRHFNEMRVFHEGVATAVELSALTPGIEDERLQMERWAAAVDARGRIPFSVLCNNQVLDQTRDDNVVYPLGYIVASSLVEIGGPAMPRKMMETLRKLTMPTGYRPEQLWGTLLQRNGVSLEMLNSTYEGKLDELQKRESVFLAGLPRLKSNVSVEADTIIIRIEPFEGASESAKPVCGIENKRLLRSEVDFIHRQEDGSFRFPRSSITSSRMRYLIGWSTPEASFPIFEPWMDVILPQ
jgi:hypothetical protein